MSEPISLDFVCHTLGNGLRVVLHRDRRAPLVAVNLWYHVGSKNEAPGRSGFAHLFEHLLFQGSEHVGTNDHFRLVQQAGGSANGSTWFDRTNYYEVMPVHHLDLALWLEADRMGFFLPAITQEKLDNQREVVINERRQRIDNQPYGRAFERLHELLYPSGHPYRWPVIGYVEDVRAASLADVSEFFSTYYVPRNAVLTLAGDFGDDALERIDRYFGTIPAGSPVPRPAVPEVAALAETTAALGARREVLPDQVELARIYMAFVVPPFGRREWYAADLLAGVLADGKSSLLYRDLVYERQLAQDVTSYVLSTEAAATFAVIATASADADPAHLEAALAEHLRALAAQPPAAHHLERARRRLVTSHFHQLQNLEDRADLLSQHTTYFNDPSHALSEPALYEGIEPADLTALVNHFCRPEQAAVVTVLPDRRPASTLDLAPPAAPHEPVSAAAEGSP